jgi:hypothetical protein
MESAKSQIAFTMSVTEWDASRCVERELTRHIVEVRHTTSCPHPADLSLIRQAPDGWEPRNKSLTHQLLERYPNVPQSDGTRHSVKGCIIVAGGRADPVANTTMSAFSVDPSSKTRLSVVKLFTLPLLSLILPSMISWLAPTSSCRRGD